MLLSLPLSRRRSMFCAAVAFAALASFTPAWAADTTVTISNFAFTPTETTISVGDTVTFKNGDDTIHSVLADDNSFHSQALDTGDEFSFKFVKAGVFSYHCGLHPFMQGKITVK